MDEEIRITKVSDNKTIITDNSIDYLIIKWKENLLFKKREYVRRNKRKKL